jgi:hypothetical protein
MAHVRVDALQRQQAISIRARARGARCTFMSFAPATAGKRVDGGECSIKACIAPGAAPQSHCGGT